MKIDVYNQSGSVVESIDANPAMFEVAVNKQLMHQALVRQLANARQATAKAKRKGEVRGGGRKPYKQKGTGRARAGSTRSPLWVGGGVVFGPTGNENHTRAMNKKERRKALFMALSDKLAGSDVLALDGFTSQDAKTKDAAAMLTALPGDRTTLIVVSREDDVLARCARNIPTATVLLVNYLNIHDIMRHTKVVFSKSALAEAEALFVK